MDDLVARFKVTNGSGFLLKDFDPGYTGSLKKEDSDEILRDLIKRTSLLQSKLYADNRYSLLILFQAMDAAGKDGAIAHTLSGLNRKDVKFTALKSQVPRSFSTIFYGGILKFYRVAGKLVCITDHIMKMY